MRVFRSRLQYPRSKQHHVRSLFRRSSRRLQKKLWSTKLRIEAEIRVEEGTAAELKSQVETVFNKNEMIDVIGCTRGHGYKGVVTRWSAPGCRGSHIVVSGRMRVLERGIQPAFSGKVPRAGQSGFHHRDHAGRSQRGVQQIGAPTPAPQEGETARRRHSSGARRRSVVTC